MYSIPIPSNGMFFDTTGSSLSMITASSLEYPHPPFIGSSPTTDLKTAQITSLGFSSDLILGACISIAMMSPYLIPNFIIKNIRDIRSKGLKTRPNKSRIFFLLTVKT